MAPFVLAYGKDGEVEITLYGDIVRERPYDWFNGKPSDGSFIILDEFLDGLKRVDGSRDVRVRIHSVGGAVDVALVIHNRLRELSLGGVRVDVVVDGVAMSAGAVIMCAGDSVSVYPGSLVMVHNSSMFVFEQMRARDMRVALASLDGHDRSMAAVLSAKSGLTVDRVGELMEAETYFTGREAVDNGFADTLLDGPGIEVAASADRRTLFAGGLPVWSAAGGSIGLPDSVCVPVFPVGGVPRVASRSASEGGGFDALPAGINNVMGGNVLGMSICEAKKEFPENAVALAPDRSPGVGAANADEALAMAVEAALMGDRERLMDIDKISALIDPGLVAEAKFGDKACSAQELAYRAALRAAEKGREFLAGIDADAVESGVSRVGVSPGAMEGGLDGGDSAGGESPGAFGKRVAMLHKIMNGGVGGE